jgi:hypothetical protein
MISGPTKQRKCLSLGWHGGNKGKNRTEWNFELWCEQNRLSGLNYAIRGHIIQEALNMEHENGWKHLD